MPKPFNEIEKLNLKYINIWEEFCNIERPTNYKKGADKCGEYVIKWARALRFEVERCPQEKAEDAICITMNSCATGEPVCIRSYG